MLKMSLFEVFSDPNFSAFGLNTKIYFVLICNFSEIKYKLMPAETGGYTGDSSPQDFCQIRSFMD